jgi:hypothetical protein
MSGGYVGRALWRPDDTPGVWAYEPYTNAAVGDRRRERCLGDGTHTRYWITPEVAREIDAQIASPLQDERGRGGGYVRPDFTSAARR